MRSKNGKNEIPEGGLRRKQAARKRDAVSGGHGDGGQNVGEAGDLPIGTDRTAATGTGKAAVCKCSGSESECGGSGRGYSVRLRINPRAHGGTLGLLIRKTERRKQSIRRSISILEDQIKALHLELEQETEDLQELKRLLANWQANIDRLREIREGELDYTEGSE